ncbi:hypothetical protein JXK06_01620 [Patescibacteria group bacterium]|nr:hypothetical protein [Patescibacteria group bacterium]
MKKAFLVLLLMVLVASTAFASVRIKPRTVAPIGKFTIVGSVVVEYQPNAEDGSFSLDVFRKENKRVFLKKKITDDVFGVNMADVCPGTKKRVYLVRAVSNPRTAKQIMYTTAEALEFIQEQKAEVPTLAFALMLQKQYGLIWEQATAIFTERSIPSKDGSMTLIPLIDIEGNIGLVSQEYPWENHDFIFMVDEPIAEVKGEVPVLSER